MEKLLVNLPARHLKEPFNQTFFSLLEVHFGLLKIHVKHFTLFDSINSPPQ